MDSHSKNEITPETQKHIRTLCDNIATAESLTPDLHDELYTHIEDKILGYLNNEETLSEADAFLLAREHFGDRAVVRDQLSQVHPVEVPHSFLRRLLIPVILIITLEYALDVSFLVVQMLYQVLPTNPLLFKSYPLLVTVLFLATQFILLHRWKKKEQKLKRKLLTT